MGKWYTETIVETGRSGVFWMLIAFVATFAITRGVTRYIRARAVRDPGPAPDGREAQGGGVVRDVHIGGVHVHHQVWGILLLLIVGVIELARRPDSPGLEVLGALFGVGAALTLDEFALWLHLDDVYWSQEGRKSIDAVVIAACIGGALLLGSAPFGVDASATSQGFTVVAATIATQLVLSIIAALKGKIPTALIGIVVPIVSLVGSIRLAKPDSPWARWRYTSRPKRMARAHKRFAGAGEPGVMDRVRDLLGGG